MSDPTPIRAVLLDLGDTLWPGPRSPRRLRPAFEAIRRELAARYGPEVPGAASLEERITRHVGRLLRRHREREPETEADWEHAMTAALAALSFWPGPDFVRWAVEQWCAADAAGTAVEPSKLAVLAALRERGLRLAVVSNTVTPPSFMDRFLAEQGVLPYLSARAYSSAVGYRKPHPRIYQAALDGLLVPAAEAVFVGDDPQGDVAGPQALGMRTVLTREYRQGPPEGGPRPDAVIQRLEELPAVLERMQAGGDA
ncbi:MAG TPA: HAD family hydrolase [Dehalococcoidia bacterium]